MLRLNLSVLTIPSSDYPTEDWESKGIKYADEVLDARDFAKAIAGELENDPLNAAYRGVRAGMAWAKMERRDAIG